MTDRCFKNSGVGGQPGHRQRLDIALQGAVIEHRAGDIVEPQALAKHMQLAGGFRVEACHRYSLLNAMFVIRGGMQPSVRRLPAHRLDILQIANPFEHPIGRGELLDRLGI